MQVKWCVSLSTCKVVSLLWPSFPPPLYNNTLQLLLLLLFVITPLSSPSSDSRALAWPSSSPSARKRCILPSVAEVGGSWKAASSSSNFLRREMGADQDPAKKPEVEGTSEAVPAAETVKDVTEEKAPITPPPAEEKPDDSKALAVVEKIEETPAEKVDSDDRDAVLARVETEKRLSLIKAWEENEKIKAENKAVKKAASIVSWENAQKAAVEAELKKKEEELEKKKAEYAEKTKNKIAQIHKEAEEKKAIAEAKRGEEILRAEETAAKYRAKGFAPKKLIAWLGI